MLRSQTSFNFHFQKKDHFKHLVCKFSFCYLKTTFKNFFFPENKAPRNEVLYEIKAYVRHGTMGSKILGQSTNHIRQLLSFLLSVLDLQTCSFIITGISYGTSGNRIFIILFILQQTKNPKQRKSIFTNLYDNNRNKHKSSNSIIGQDGH